MQRLILNLARPVDFLDATGWPSSTLNEFGVAFRGALAGGALGSALRAWVRLAVVVPINVAANALEGFFETQRAMTLDGWAGEGGAHAQELRFSLESS